MSWFFLIIGLTLTLWDIFFIAKTLQGNIIKRFVFILSGVTIIKVIYPSYMLITYKETLISLIIGLVFLTTHLLIAKGIKLRFSDINVGIIKTCILIYFIELPAEELLYRGILLIPLINMTNPVIAIFISSMLFGTLHIKTWNNKFVWIGSFLLAMTCAISVVILKSIWTAIIIHNLNDFGYLTLVNKRDIFTQRSANYK